MSVPIHRLNDLAETCVFAKQSRGSRHCGFIHPFRMNFKNKPPLLPKLRGYFAEFLREYYLERLSILYPPTCVRLQYG